MGKPRAKRVTAEVRRGRAGWVYSDGSFRDDNGYFIERPPQAAPQITAETAPAMHERRMSLSREKTREGIAAGLGLQRSSGGEEWAELTKIFVQRFKESESVRGMAEAYHQLGRASGYVAPEEEAAESVVSAVLKLFARLERENDNIVEGQVIDAKQLP